MATKGKQVIMSIYLDPAVHDLLKKLSSETGAPVAHYLRKGADAILAEHGLKVDKPSIAASKVKRTK